MTADQILMSVYIIILVEIGILILVLLIMLIEIKESVDKVRGLINRAIHLGDMTVGAAENVKSSLGSASGVMTALKSVPDIMSMISNIRSGMTSSQKNTTNNDEDILSETLRQSVPKKKKRII